MTKEIDIAFITDDNYAMPTYVALISLLKNKNTQSVYNVYVLYSDVKAEHLKYMQNLITKKDENNSILSVWVSCCRN